ncbi:hypothetical protein JYQ62_01460 [Nostoc sp. UHCC 0702]|nr:hypothetical protein JYQ62_01460 [Nostoc sp. UHCC 0702]
MGKFQFIKNLQKAAAKAPFNAIQQHRSSQISHKLGISKASLTTFAILGISAGFTLFSSPASATLLVRDTFNDAALSIDAFGSTSNVGTIQTNVPTGATVLKAYLYASSIWNFGPVNNVSLNGNLLQVADGTILSPDSNPATTVRWDVTSLLSSLGGGLQDLTIEELGDNDGETLVVAYQDASTTGLTSVILDGELSTTGDTTRFDFADPYTSGDFLASLAGSFSFQPAGQYSTIDVTTNSTISRRLTSSAGGQDDGEGANGALITAGGIGDDPTNPDPFASDSGGPRTDDELYNLALGNTVDPTPFINTGDDFIELTTINPSNDDNVFGLFVTSEFKIDPEPIPEPSTTLGALAFAAFGASSWLKRKQKYDKLS